MSLENIFPNKEQFDTMNTLLASIASNTGSGIKVNNFADVQQLTRLGLAKKVFGVAEQFIAEKETSIVAGVGDSTGITAVTVDQIKFITALGTAHEAIYEATYDGAVWHKENGDNIVLADYGITVTGTAAKNDHIVITVHTSNLAFDIVDFNKHTPRNSRFTNSIALLLHDIATYGTIPFCASQLLYYTDVELPAGNYKFTLDHARYGNGTEYDGTYMFTTTKAIPAGGGFRHTNIGGWKSAYAKSDVIGNYITLYGVRPERTEIQSGITVSEYDGTTTCTDLGTFTAQSRTYHTDDGKHNFTERNAYGSNRWRDSVYRQWLNSDEVRRLVIGGLRKAYSTEFRAARKTQVSFTDSIPILSTRSAKSKSKPRYILATARAMRPTILPTIKSSSFRERKCSARTNIRAFRREVCSNTSTERRMRIVSNIKTV